MAYMRLGDLLVSSGVITEAQLEQALSVPKEDGQRLGDVLIQHGFITEAQLIDALRVQLGVDFVDLTAVSLPMELAQYVPRTIAKKYDVVPVKLVQDRLYHHRHLPDRQYRRPCRCQRQHRQGGRQQLLLSGYQRQYRLQLPAQVPRL